jgi:surface antigen Omp85-like protein
MRLGRSLMLVVAVTGRAAADDPPAPAPEEPSAPEVKPPPSAADVAGAPQPGDESGRTDPQEGDSTLRQVGRGALWVPKLAWNVALSPVRASIWAYERYELDELYRRIFFNDALTMGLYPTVGYETGFGFTGGGRFVHRDLFGKHEHLALQAATGGRFKQIYSAQLRTGNRFERVGFELDAGWERRPHDEFFGIGNGDIAAMPAGTTIDPRTDPTAVESRYSQDHGRVIATGDVRVISDLHLRPAVAYSDLAFGAGDQGPATDMVYDRAGLVGIDGFRLGYGELEVRWDNRYKDPAFEPGAFAAGWLAAAFGGRAHRFDGGTDYWRYGIDIQHFLRLGDGPRVLATRLHGEAVSGSIDEVPFTELPKLGGLTYMRGYALDRFRDRIAAFGSAEYQWDLSALFSASVFADVGRVYSSMADLSVDHMRLGYGVALEAHNLSEFLLQGSIASSIDGGLFFNLTFNPVFDLDERVRRK